MVIKTGVWAWVVYRGRSVRLSAACVSCGRSRCFAAGAAGGGTFCGVGVGGGHGMCGAQSLVIVSLLDVSGAFLEWVN